MYHYASNNPVRYLDPTGRADADTFYKVAKELFEKAPNVAVADSPAPGPCDIVALGILVTAVSALAVGGCIDLYNYAKLANEKIAKDDPYVSIVVTRAPKEAYIHVDSIIDAPSAVIVLKENLPLLTPALPLPLGK